MQEGWWPWILLGVFATHGPFFAWRYRRSGERRHAATALTFALLSLAYAVRVFAPEARLAGWPLFGILRVPAWAAAAVSLSLLARHLMTRRRESPRRA